MHLKLCDLERDIRKRKLPLESGFFHATEDKQPVRNEVYNILNDKNLQYDIDSVVVEKNRANPVIREVPKIYKKVYAILLKWIFDRYMDISKVVIFVDVVPDSKKRKDIEKGLVETLSDLLDKRAVRYHIMFMPAVFSYGLQAVDYCCWAHKKKWGDWGDKIDLRPYSCISHKIRSEFNVFQHGDGTIYY